MTDNEKIQEEFEEWYLSRQTNYSAYSGQLEAFTAGYIRGQREAIMQYLADDAQRYGDYEV